MLGSPPPPAMEIGLGEMVRVAAGHGAVVRLGSSDAASSACGRWPAGRPRKEEEEEGEGPFDLDSMALKSEWRKCKFAVNFFVDRLWN